MAVSRKASRRSTGRKARGRRKSTARRKAPARRKARSARKGAQKKKTARKRKVARKAAPRRKAAKKGGRKKATGKPARKKGAASKVSAVDALARKIVRATASDSGSVDLAEFYSDAISSQESGGAPAAKGLAGLRQKTATWNQMQQGQKWKARNVLVKGNTIVIEWDAEITLRGGRKVPFREVAVHEVKGGKIVNERFYYDPAQLNPPAAARPPGPPPGPSRVPTGGMSRGPSGSPGGGGGMPSGGGPSGGRPPGGLPSGGGPSSGGSPGGSRPGGGVRGPGSVDPRDL